ncbi:hypothetical protein [Roseinatronobacter sp. NSM]|uniref:hypothetical protein n=1 Tax=Roseinatronobacter sp. NSM TaxID=3457785 RepID=UPI0040353D07
MPGDASIGRIFLNAAVLLVEAAILITIAEVILKAFYTSDAATKSALDAQQKAEELRVEQARMDAEVAARKMSEKNVSCASWKRACCA